MPEFSANLSLLFRESPPIDRFAAARAAGFSAVEIQFPYAIEPDLIRRELDRHDLALVLINVPAGDLMDGGDGLACVPGRETAFRQAVSEALAYAEALDVRRINVLAGRQPAGAELLACLETLAVNLQYAADAFEDIGAITTFEAINTHDMPRFLVSTVSQMQEMREAVAHPSLKMQFDCYHMARMGEDLAASLRENLPDIGHIQFADVPGRGQPGTGGLDFAALFRLIDEAGYRGYCGAEYHPTAATADSLGWFAPYRQGGYR